MKKISYLFISTGAQTKMFTLCAAYQHIDSNGQVASNSIGYIQNLSNNRERAIEKAISHAAKIGKDIRLDVDLFELNAFEKRDTTPKMTSEEKRKKKAEEKKEEIEKEFNVMLTKGVMQIGKYTGMTAAEVYAVKPTYIEYAAQQRKYAVDHRLGMYFVNRMAINATLCQQFIDENPEKFVKAEIKESAPIGNIGDKMDLTITIKSKTIVDGFVYNTTQLRVNGVDEQNNQVVLYTNSSDMHNSTIGEKLTLVGVTIKKHTTAYNGKATIVGGRFKVKK